MSSRISLTLALALLALAGIPSVRTQEEPHSMLRRRLDFELPLADKSIVKDADLEVVKLPKWNGNVIEIPFLASLSHKDEN